MKTLFPLVWMLPGAWDSRHGKRRPRRRDLYEAWNPGSGGWNPPESLLHGERLACSRVRLGLGRLGAGLDDRATAGCKVDTRVQLRSRRRGI